MNTIPNQEELSKKPNRLKEMVSAIDAIIEGAKALENHSRPLLEKIHPHYQKSACNLLHYRAFRRLDSRDLQKKLGYLGLSRLAKSQSHVMASLQTNRSFLQAMLKDEPIRFAADELSFKKGARMLNSNAKSLLGYRTKSRRTRIMVTMPSESAYNYQLVYDLLKAGMNCARINCAHDDPTTWKKIIDHVRRASKALKKKCKIAMDLAGPKIRTGPIIEGPKVQKFRPQKDVWGKINQPLKVWIGPQPKLDFLNVPVEEGDLARWKVKDVLYFRDTREKNRRITLVEKVEKGFVGHCFKTTFLKSGMPLFTNKKLLGQPIIVGEIPPVEIALLLKKGDTLRLDKEPLPGEPPQYDEAGDLISEAHISCTFPSIFEQVKPGERILFDDGKIRGLVKSVEEESLFVEIIYAAEGGVKLRADKGINLPDTQLTISGLTEKDKKDLVFIAQHADAVNFSFVNRPQDVQELIVELEKLKAKDRLSIILKIETQSGFNHLTEILLAAMQVFPIGVMIARGDLAIESGWNNIGRVQEEILSLCQAAHVTDIWATQVLEGLAKKGIPSRAEITDAVMAQRSDCVMLNKGPYILDAIRLLSSILEDMESYWEKNAPLSPMMAKANIHP